MASVNRTIDLLRHGEPVGGSRYRGHGVDDPLSEKGWRQMWEGVGENFSWELIISSPLQRCADFSRNLAERHDIPLLIDERFREIGFGEWEGKTRAELQANNGHEFHSFYADPVNNTPTGAEPVSEFYQRVNAAFQDIRLQNPVGDLLIVAHAGVIRAIVAGAIQAGLASMYKLTIQNGCIARLFDTGDRLMLEGLNLRLSRY